MIYHTLPSTASHYIALHYTTLHLHTSLEYVSLGCVCVCVSQLAAVCKPVPTYVAFHPAMIDRF